VTGSTSRRWRTSSGPARASSLAAIATTRRPWSRSASARPSGPRPAPTSPPGWGGRTPPGHAGLGPAH
jgi:hypothetical protein